MDEAWEDRYTHGRLSPEVDEEPLSPLSARDINGRPILGDPSTFTNELPDTAFSLDDLITAVEVAGKVPEMEETPMATLLAWGVPVNSQCLVDTNRNFLDMNIGCDPDSEIESPTQPSRKLPEVTDPTLLAVERRLSVKIDTLIGKVDVMNQHAKRLSQETIAPVADESTEVFRTATTVKKFRPSVSAAEITVDSALDKYMVEATSPPPPESIRVTPLSPLILSSTTIDQPKTMSPKTQSEEAEPELQVPRGPCSRYQIDFSAKCFGLCHCGFSRKDHGKINSMPGVAPTSAEKVQTRAKDLFKKDQRGSLDRHNSQTLKGPCGNYRINFSAKSFGLCVCGHYRKDHGKRTSVSGLDEMNPEELGELRGLDATPLFSGPASGVFSTTTTALAPGVTSPTVDTDVTASLRKESGSSPASVTTLFTPPPLKDLLEYTNFEESEVSDTPEQTVLAKVDAKIWHLEEKDVVAAEQQCHAHLQSSLKEISTLRKVHHDLPEPIARHSDSSPCEEYKADFHADEFGICMCGYYRDDHNLACPIKRKTVASAETLKREIVADLERCETTGVTPPPLKDLPEYKPFLDKLDAGGDIDILARKMQIKGLNPDALRMDRRLTVPALAANGVVGKTTYTVEVLRLPADQLPQDIDPHNREDYLSVDEFFEVFGMDHDDYTDLPKWKKVQCKKKAGLF
jgi:hypothetical protein